MIRIIRFIGLRQQAKRNEFTRHLSGGKPPVCTILDLAFLLLIVVSSFFLWNENKLVTNVVDCSFQIARNGEYLKFSFSLINVKNQRVRGDGSGYIHIYDCDEKLIYKGEFRFSRGIFFAQDQEYVFSIPIKDLELSLPETEITLEFIRKGRAVLTLKLNDGKILVKDTAVTLYSESEAKTLVKKLVEKKLKKWVNNDENYRYLSGAKVEDIAFVKQHIWAAVNDLGAFFIFHSSDCGNSWEIQWGNCLSIFTPPFKVALLDENEVAISFCIFSDGNILYTIDGGKNWKYVWEASFLSLIKIEDLKIISYMHLWASLSNGSAIYSTDGGRSWQVQKSG